MTGPEQLDVAKFRTLSFRSTRVQQASAGQLRVTGDLSLRGQTHSVSFLANVESQGALLHARATLRFRQSSFGMTPYSTIGIRNQDEVELQIDLVAE
jgi:polyisoprenoid-binding protein YceI